MKIVKSSFIKTFLTAVGSLSLVIALVCPVPSAFASTATKLVVTTSAATAASGAAFGTQPVITVEDASSATVTGVGGTVSVRVNLGGQLVGTTTAAINSATGIATFSGLGLSGTAGTSYQLTFSVGGLTSATQNITPTIGVATSLAITTYGVPAGGTQPATLSPQPVITFKDSGNNTVTSNSSSVVTASAAGGASVAGTTTATASSGVATFSGLKATTSSNTTGYTLTFTSGSLSATQNFYRGSGGTSAQAPAGITSGALSGTATVGNSLSVATPTLTTAGRPVTEDYYQWSRAGTPITGAISNSYALTASDLGSVISVVTTARNASGSVASSAVSSAAVTSAPD